MNVEGGQPDLGRACLRARAWGRRVRVREAPLTTNRDPHAWGVGFQRCQMASRSKRWLPVALLMACTVSVHGMGRARAAQEVADEKAELQHKQLEKQFGEVLTNNQVQMLITEKNMLSFKLPGATHKPAHDLDRALSAIKPEEMPQEKVVLAVQKIAKKRAHLKLGLPAEYIKLLTVTIQTLCMAYVCMLVYHYLTISEFGIWSITFHMANALRALSNLAAKSAENFTERAKSASSSVSAAPTPKPKPAPKAKEAAKPKAREIAKPKASGDAAKSGSEPANGESAAVQRMKKLLETL